MAFKRKDYDRLMGNIDIIKVISPYVALRKRSADKNGYGGHEYIGLCPFHKEETPSFGVTWTKQFYHCHGCGSTGNAVIFLQKFLGLSGGKAVVRAAEMCGIRVLQGPSSPSPKKLRDRKKYERKTVHRRNVVWRRESNARRALTRNRTPGANSLFADEFDDDIPF